MWFFGVWTAEHPSITLLRSNVAKHGSHGRGLSEDIYATCLPQSSVKLHLSRSIPRKIPIFCWLEQLEHEILVSLRYILSYSHDIPIISRSDWICTKSIMACTAQWPRPSGPTPPSPWPLRPRPPLPSRRSLSHPGAVKWIGTKVVAMEKRWGKGGFDRETWGKFGFNMF